MTVQGSDSGHDGKCGAAKRKGGTCTQAAGWGTDHPGIGKCKLHGGSTPNHQRSAQLELARQAITRLGQQIPEDEATPTLIMIGLVRESAGNVEFYRRAVATDDPQDLIWRETGPGGAAKQVKSVWLVVYDEERDRLARYIKEAIGLGIEERRLRLEEADARTLMEGFSKAVTAAKLSPEQTEVLRRVFADHLRQSRAPGLAG